jgi:hypothetical protein
MHDPEYDEESSSISNEMEKSRLPIKQGAKIIKNLK